MKFECILLGLINLHPSISGYELKAIINNSTGYFFSATLSMIYPALKQLAGKGYITFEVEPLVGKQDRKVYTITPEGLQELTAWLREPLSLNQSLNDFQNFLLKLTFLGILDNESILTYLKAGKKFFEDERKRFADNNLANEKNYIKMDPTLEQRHITLWSHENEFIIEDLNRKVQWIENLIKIVEAEGILPVEGAPGRIRE